MISPQMGQHKSLRSSSLHSCCPRLPPAAGECEDALGRPCPCWDAGDLRKETPAVLLPTLCCLGCSCSAGSCLGRDLPFPNHWKDTRDAQPTGGFLGQLRAGGLKKWSNVAKQLGEDCSSLGGGSSPACSVPVCLPAPAASATASAASSALTQMPNK